MGNIIILYLVYSQTGNHENFRVSQYEEKAVIDIRKPIFTEKYYAVLLYPGKTNL